MARVNSGYDKPSGVMSYGDLYNQIFILRSDINRDIGKGGPNQPAIDEVLKTISNRLTTILRSY